MKNQKNIFLVADFPEKITQINNGYPYLKEKEQIILHKIIDSLKKEGKKILKNFLMN